MKTSHSKSLELDYKSIVSVAIAFITMLSTFYIANLEPINEIVSKYMSADLFKIFTLVALYLAKKFIKDYSK